MKKFFLVLVLGVFLCPHLTMAGGNGSTAEFNSSVVISEEDVQIFPDINFNHDTGDEGLTNWSYSNPSQSITINRKGIKDIELSQGDHNSSFTNGEKNGSASATSDISLEGNLKTKDSEATISLSSNSVTVSWHNVTYHDLYGECVNAGAEATVGSTLNSSSQNFNPITRADVNLSSSSIAHSPDGVLSASGNLTSTQMINGSLATTHYRTETNASVFGAGNIHSGHASVKFSKTLD